MRTNYTDYNALNQKATYLDPENWRVNAKARPVVGLIMVQAPEVVCASSLRAMIAYLNEINLGTVFNYNTVCDRIAKKGYYGSTKVIIVRDEREDGTQSLPEWSTFEETRRVVTLIPGKPVYVRDRSGKEVVYRSVVEMEANCKDFGVLSRMYHWLHKHPIYITPSRSHLIMTRDKEADRDALVAYINAHDYLSISNVGTDPFLVKRVAYTIWSILGSVLDERKNSILNQLITDDWYYDSYRNRLFLHKRFIRNPELLDELPIKYRDCVEKALQYRDRV